jgi:hypothetical protein
VSLARRRRSQVRLRRRWADQLIAIAAAGLDPTMVGLTAAGSYVGFGINSGYQPDIGAVLVYDLRNGHRKLNPRPAVHGQYPYVDSFVMTRTGERTDAPLGATAVAMH